MRSIVGLSGPFSRAGRAHCPRCKKSVDATWPWAGWGRLRKAYFGGLLLLVCLSPVWMSDMSVMLPSALVFVSAVGPVNALAKIRPTCLRCGGVVESVRA
ncbi:MAG TPA: hypothetical protein VGI70_14050, partial [Polyangiales bacterium]